MIMPRYLGRKGIEPLIASAIEFTAQPVIPTNGTFLYYFKFRVLYSRFIYCCLRNARANRTKNKRVNLFS